MLKTGDLAPDFDLPRSGGGSIRLSALRPGAVVVYFYPRDNTPACTTEAVDFTALAPRFAAAGCTVIGVSRDSVRTHDNFCRKHGLGVVLVSDAEAVACAAFGVWVERRMYGRSYMGIARTTFLLDGTGRVAQVWPDVSVAGHAAAVLAAAEAL